MEETSTPPPSLPPVPQENKLVWLAASFVMPFYSINFYRAAVRKPLRQAVFFFILLMTIITALVYLPTRGRMDTLSAEITQSFAQDGFPTITISKGTASVEGEQPHILVDQDGLFFAIDTTGQIAKIDTIQYRQGMLLTQTDLQMYDGVQYQTFKLQDLNNGFQTDPIVIDQAVVQSAIDQLLPLFFLFAMLFIWLWNIILRLLFVVGLGFALWFPVSMLRPNFPLRVILIPGLYAILPALFFDHLLGLFNVVIPSMQTILLLAFWVGTLYLLFRQPAGEAIPPVKLRDVLIGFPMLIAVAINMVLMNADAPIPLMGLAFVTIALLLYLDGRETAPPATSEVK